MTARDFAACKSGSRNIHGKRFMLVLKKKDHNSSRLGVIVTKKTGNAVVRNRWKRLIRESFRTQKGLRPGYDHVLIVRKSPKGKPGLDARRELKTLFARI